jgi:hypothetical protein
MMNEDIIMDHSVKAMPGDKEGEKEQRKKERNLDLTDAQ